MDLHWNSLYPTAVRSYDWIFQIVKPEGECLLFKHLKLQADYERSSSDRNYDGFGDGIDLEKHCACGPVKSIGHKSMQTCRNTALNRSESRNRWKSKSTGPDPSKWIAIDFVKWTEFFIDLGHASRDSFKDGESRACHWELRGCCT